MHVQSKDSTESHCAGEIKLNLYERRHELTIGLKSTLPFETR